MKVSPTLVLPLGWQSWALLPSSSHVYPTVTLLCLPPTCSKYYEKEALLMDPVDGPILASLLGKGWRLAGHPRGLQSTPIPRVLTCRKPVN